mgnify:FL=1|jgi:hypothetical protein
MSADVIFSIESETMESRGRGIFGYRSDASTQNFSVHFNGTGIFVDFNNSVSSQPTVRPTRAAPFMRLTVFSTLSTIGTDSWKPVRHRFALWDVVKGAVYEGESHA